MRYIERKQPAVLCILALVLMVVFLLPASLFSQDSSAKKAKTDKLFQMSLEELMNVKISTAGKTPERIGDIPASVVLITREEIETFGYTTLSEILENIPGLYAIDDYRETGPNFGVRGFWSGQSNDNMIILVNGVHQVNDFLSNYPLHKISIPVEAIDRIEVIRGPMSVIYGNGAFYGVINIITNDTLRESESIISASYGSSNTRKLFARMAGDEGDFSYVFNASLYDTDGLDEPLSAMVQDPSQPLVGVPINSTTAKKLENTEKYFNFSGSFRGLHLNMSYNESNREFYFSFPSTSNGSLNHDIAAHIDIKYQKKISDQLTLEGKFSYAHNRDWYNYKVLYDDYYGIQDIEANGFEVEANGFIYPNSRLEIKTGAYYRAVLNVKNMYDLPGFGIPSLENHTTYLDDKDDIVTQAVYTQVSYDVSDHLQLIAGLRLEQTPQYGLGKLQVVGSTVMQDTHRVYDREEIELIPRIAAIYYLNDHHIFKFLFNTAINRPSFAQNATNALNPPNPVLEPESIQTLELNYIGTFSSNLTFNASFFRNSLENLITRVVEFDDNGQYRTWSANAGKMITYGMELSLNLELLDKLRLELSGSFQKTEDKRPEYENIDVAYSPQCLGYIKMSYHHEWFRLALTGNYVSSMETFWDETKSSTAGPGDFIGKRAGSYLLLSANIRFDDLFLDGLYLNIHCANILDTDIYYPTFTLNQWAYQGTLGIRRSFILSLGYKF